MIRLKKLLYSKMLLEGKTIDDIRKEFYPEKSDIDGNLLIYRFIRTAEASEIIKIVKSGSKIKNFRDVKIIKTDKYDSLLKKFLDEGRDL